MFARIYGAVFVASYFLLGTVVRSMAQGGVVDGLEWVVIWSPHSLLKALEGAGYIFMGMATVVSGLAWRVPGRWRRVIRWLLIINGAVCILGVVAGVFGFVEGSACALGVWAGTFPVAAVLLAVRFRQDLRLAPVSSGVLSA